MFVRTKVRKSAEKLSGNLSFRHTEALALVRNGRASCSERARFLFGTGNRFFLPPGGRDIFRAVWDGKSKIMRTFAVKIKNASSFTDDRLMGLTGFDSGQKW